MYNTLFYTFKTILFINLVIKFDFIAKESENCDKTFNKIRFFCRFRKLG